MTGQPHGEIDPADADWGTFLWLAFITGAKPAAKASVNSLSMITDELYHEARKQYGDDPAINALNDVITSFYTSISNR